MSHLERALQWYSSLTSPQDGHTSAVCIKVMPVTTLVLGTMLGFNMYLDGYKDRWMNG